MIKTYESFIGDYILNKIKSGAKKANGYVFTPNESENSEPRHAPWNDEQLKVLGKFGDVSDYTSFMFNSIMNDMSIEAEKYIDHSSGIPGYAEYYFNVNVNDVRKKSFKSFEELVKYLEEIIPQEELDANKYNL